MKRRITMLLLAIPFLFCASAGAQDAWIPVATPEQAEAAQDWIEPDSPLLAMAREDSLIHYEDIDAPLRAFLQTRARCIFDTLYPSQLMRRLAWVRELDLSPYDGALRDARWLWMFQSLEKITLTDAALTDLEVIGGFPELTELTLLNCGLFDLTPLKNCAKLASLSLGWDDAYAAPSGAFDLSPLAGLKNLQTVALYGPGITGVEPLAQNARRYRELTFSGTRIGDFGAMGDFQNLEALTIDQLDGAAAAGLLSACPSTVKSLTLRRLALDEELETIVKRFKKLTYCTVAGCSVSDPLFFEGLNKSAALTLQNVSLPDGQSVGEVYADKTAMILRGAPEAVTLSLLNNRASSLRALIVEIEALTEELNAALKKRTSLTDLTVVLRADLDLASDAWKRLTDLRGLTIASEGKTLLSTDFLGDLARVRTLTLSGVEIEHTAGIENLKNLTQLNVYGCRIADWGFLAALKNLTVVKIYGSELTSDALPPLAALPKLDELRLNGNRITDISALPASKTIRKLDILGNPIADYAPLLDMPALSIVYLDQGGIITDSRVIARSAYVDDVDYEAINQAAFGAEKEAAE